MQFDETIIQIKNLLNFENISDIENNFLLLWSIDKQSYFKLTMRQFFSFINANTKKYIRQIKLLERKINNYLPHIGESQYFTFQPLNPYWLEASSGTYYNKELYSDFWNYLYELKNNGNENIKFYTDEYYDYDAVLNISENTFRLPKINLSENEYDINKEPQSISSNKIYSDQRTWTNNDDKKTIKLIDPGIYIFNVKWKTDYLANGKTRSGYNNIGRNDYADGYLQHFFGLHNQEKINNGQNFLFFLIKKAFLWPKYNQTPVDIDKFTDVENKFVAYFITYTPNVIICCKSLNIDLNESTVNYYKFENLNQKLYYYIKR